MECQVLVNRAASGSIAGTASNTSRPAAQPATTSEIQWVARYTVLSPIVTLKTVASTAQARRYRRARYANRPQVRTAFAVCPDGQMVPSANTAPAPGRSAAGPSCSGPSRPTTIFTKPTLMLSRTVAVPKINSGCTSRARTARTTS
ncbi:hypothetical protein SAMN05661080_05037 [Modestobacter sp. DSM 44400]|nr:hypothetical protein SAMN05661080_05037 [Modestobacter sp. DSM 44400]